MSKIPYIKAKQVNTQNSSSGGGILEIMKGATSTTDGKAGAVPQPKAGDNYRFLRGDGSWSAAQGEQGVGITDIVQNDDYTLTIAMTDGTSYTTSPVRGERGDKGDKGDKGEQGIRGLQGIQGIQGDKGDVGDKGDTGNGIKEIKKTSSSGDTDIYTIYMTDGTTQSYTVTNGSYKESVIQTVMKASKWIENTYPFDNYPIESYNLEIEPDGNRVRLAQYDAWSNAKIVGSATSNTCIALGDVPNVDIPIILKAVVLS